MCPRKYKQCHKLQVCFTKEQYEYIQRIANKNNITKNETVRQAIDTIFNLKKIIQDYNINQEDVINGNK